MYKENLSLNTHIHVAIDVVGTCYGRSQEWVG